MSAIKDIATTFACLAEGEEITRAERAAVIDYLLHEQAAEADGSGESDAARERPTTVALADGRMVDVFRSGGVQVYTSDMSSAYEIQLPEVGATEPVTVNRLG